MSVAAMKIVNVDRETAKVFLLTGAMKKTNPESGRTRNSRFQPVDQVLARFDNLDEMFAAA